MKTLKMLFVVLIADFIMVAIFFAVNPYNVALMHGKSMNPFLQEGDIVITRNISVVDRRQAKKLSGGIIVFDMNGDKVIHRVVKILEREVITRGDNNWGINDDPIKISEIQSLYLLKLPTSVLGLGALVSVFQKTIFGLSVGLIASVVLFVMLLFSIRRRTEKSANN